MWYDDGRTVVVWDPRNEVGGELLSHIGNVIHVFHGKDLVLRRMQHEPTFLVLAPAEAFREGTGEEIMQAAMSGHAGVPIHVLAWQRHDQLVAVPSDRIGRIKLPLGPEALIDALADTTERVGQRPEIDAALKTLRTKIATSPLQEVA